MITKNKNLQPGLSFIEIMIVVAIIAIFAAAAGPRLFSLLGRGKRTSTQNVLNAVAAGIDQYKIDVGTYPPNLEALVKKPEGVSGWQEPYVGSEKTDNPEVPQDAWGQDLRYEVNQRGTKPPYKLWSMGDPDKDEDPIYAK